MFQHTGGVNMPFSNPHLTTDPSMIDPNARSRNGTPTQTGVATQGGAPTNPQTKSPRVPETRGLARWPAREIARLIQQRRDQLREVVAGTVQPALHRAQVHAGDLRDLLVRLPLHLAQHEDHPVMLR